VLVLDAEESYGSSWASLSGTDFVHNLLNNSLEGQHNEQQQRQAHAAAPHGTTADTPEPGDSAGRIAVQQQQQLAGVQGCSLYTHAGLEKALDNKGLIIDLAPRVSVHIMADTNSGVALRFFCSPGYRGAVQACVGCYSCRCVTPAKQHQCIC
jgi:hypothetical protein